MFASALDLFPFLPNGATVFENFSSKDWTFLAQRGQQLSMLYRQTNPVKRTSKNDASSLSMM